jgi:hypothetical protein
VALHLLNKGGAASPRQHELGRLKIKNKKCRCGCSHAFSNTPHSQAASARQPYLKRWRCIAEAARAWAVDDKEKEMPVRLFLGFSIASHSQAASERQPYLKRWRCISEAA